MELPKLLASFIGLTKNELLQDEQFSNLFTSTNNKLVLEHNIELELFVLNQNGFSNIEVFFDYDNYGRSSTIKLNNFNTIGLFKDLYAFKIDEEYVEYSDGFMIPNEVHGRLLVELSPIPNSNSKALMISIPY